MQVAFYFAGEITQVLDPGSVVPLAMFFIIVWHLFQSLLHLCGSQLNAEQCGEMLMVAVKLHRPPNPQLSSLNSS